MFVYIHIPFCASKCIYCDFFVVLEKYGGQAAYVDTLCREIDLRLNGKTLTPIETIYIGGGTPSLLGADNYKRILKTLQQHAPLAENPEITLEANPLHMRDYPEDYLAAGFNRISIGVQSLNNTELKRLSRAHTAEDAMAFIRQVQAASFKNISIDLMYALPGQTLESWRETLEKTLSLGIQHISMYGLKVEDDTPLARLQDFDRYHPPSDEDNVRMYFTALETLEAAGYERYEFSNLSKPGYASRHNLNYWENGEYFAFGASSHGYVNHIRYETVRNLEGWFANPLSGEYRPCPESEQLENAIIFGLRKREGINIAALERQFTIDFDDRFGRIVEKYEGLGLLQKQGGRLVLPSAAIPVSNTILAEFMADPS